MKIALTLIQFLLGILLTACGTPPGTKDVDESEKNRTNLEDSLRSQGYSPQKAEQMSREYSEKQAANKKAFYSELRHQECWTNALLMTECNLEYLNRLKIRLVCQLPEDKLAPVNPLMSELSRRAAKNLPFEWSLEGKKGSAQTGRDGAAEFFYKVKRAKVTVGNLPSSDPSPPNELRVKGKGFEVKTVIEPSSEILVAFLPEHVCKNATTPD